MLTVETGLCSSCGICKSACPNKCIDLVRQGGLFLPRVDETICVNCGVCRKVCPGMELQYPEGSTPQNAMQGNVYASYNAWSKNPELRHVSASGGVVSTIVEVLLKEKRYDAAFCLDSYSYDNQLLTQLISAEGFEEDWLNSSIPKSRYLPVSHEKAVEYMLRNRDARLILIGSSCAISGFRKLISTYRLDADKYLLVGLFCDKVFNYNVIDYYQSRFGANNRISAIHFKNKESGGWPGDMKLFYEDGSTEYQPAKERVEVKEFFMPERCLYCMDKLNVRADLSIGDNFTDQNSSSLGSNCVLIRTTNGKKAWDHAIEYLEYEPCALDKICIAQYLDGRANNLYFSKLKEKRVQERTKKQIQINRGVITIEAPEEYGFAWKRALEKLRAGEVYQDNPNELYLQFKKAERRKNPKDPLVMGERILNAVKRRIKVGLR